ncbi:hypothetical protein CASFOL_007523 [Castilleja foliolosa]|uniref:Dof zinc finger protein n=1 Tax=Castilleja foliolosa TaxID=1961234 RepID=A0ABD3E9G8_9LAMI
MIQELLIKGDKKPKLSNKNPSPGGATTLDGGGSPSSPSSSAAENLRCPRCDSSNTKFCYYNNYNLTQPRHFCKTCRRYWTKGGALRSVPIGGGCRKNKNATITTAVAKSIGKLKPGSSEMIRTGLFSGLDHAHDHQAQAHISANPNMLGASSQNNYNFLSLLRANQNPNNYSNHHHLQNPVFNMGLDTVGPAHVPYSGLQGSLYRNQTPGPPGFTQGEIQSNGLQELYQRLRSPSTSCYFPENVPLILGNIASANSTPAADNSAVLESAPAGTGELGLGFWNANNISWPTIDLPTTNQLN